MSVFHDDGQVRLLLGDVRAVLRELPAESVQCVVSSPPYWSLRDYGIEPSVWGGEEHEHEWGRGVVGMAGRNDSGEQRDSFHGQLAGYGGPREVSQGQFCPCGAWRGALGLEPTPELYVAHMVEVFREVRRILRRDGTLWLNIGDSYASGGMANPSPMSTLGGGKDRGAAGYSIVRNASPGLKPKDIVGIPWMLAFALRADGWWLRQDIVWSKPNPMPESVTDRCTKAHEYLFLLTKSERYYYDADAIREVGTGASWNSATSTLAANGTKNVVLNQTGQRRTAGADTYHEDIDRTGRNKRSVWTIPTAPFPEAHFATYPPALVEPCVLAGTSEWGCCAECGAPWERVTEKLPAPHDGHTKSRYADMPNSTGHRISLARQAQRERGHEPVFGAATTGWRATCAHPDAPLTACVVLDPFVGSGTTAMVARNLGRRAIGIDLNADYLAMAVNRVGAQMALMQGAAG